MASPIFDSLLGKLTLHLHALADLAGNLTQARSHDSPDTNSAATALHHTLGTGANQAAAGNDARLSDARTPTGTAGGGLHGTYPDPDVDDDGHAHTPGISIPSYPATHDPVSIGAGGLSAKLQMAAGQILTLLGINHSDLSNVGANDHHAQAHSGEHQHGGSQEVATATPAANAIPKADASGLLDAWISLLTMVDTKANILAATKPIGKFGLATDTNEIYLSLGSGAWMKTPFALRTNIDMGFGSLPAKYGWGFDYLSDKLIANCQIGSNNKTNLQNGDFRFNGTVLQVYYGGAWQTIVSNFVFTEDPLWGYTLEHKPIGLTWNIEAMSGDSLNNLGANGLPLAQGYTVSMGAMPVPQLCGGRTIA